LSVGFDRKLWINIKGEASVDISWRKAIDPPTSSQQALYALREAIRDQKPVGGAQQVGKPCGICHVTLRPVDCFTQRQMHFHHDGKSFDTILDEWLVMKDLTLDTVPVVGKDIEPVLSEDWQSYHRANVTFKPTHAGCNQRERN
jgi:hypothetical protein